MPTFEAWPTLQALMGFDVGMRSIVIPWFNWFNGLCKYLFLSKVLNRITSNAMCSF